MVNNIQPRQREKKMLPAIRQLITLRSLSDFEKDRKVLADELIIEIKDKYPKTIPPSTSTLIKLISEDRSSKNKSPLDRPWCLGVYKYKPDLKVPSSEAIEVILKVQEYFNTHIRDFSFAHDKEILKLAETNPYDPHFNPLFDEMRKFEPLILTIRQVQWISLLHRVIGNKISRVYYISLVYSISERISEISNTPFDTTELDTNLLNWNNLKPLLFSYINKFMTNKNHESTGRYFIDYEELSK
jgi:hypothetical protein